MGNQIIVVGEERPFLYIGGIVRSGTTLLQELLTERPVAYMFHEPWFTRGLFENKDVVFETLTDWKIDIEIVNKYVLETRGRWPLYVGLLKALQDQIQQVGVKEVRHKGWQVYPRYFKNMQFVLIGRDPRDVFVSRVNYIERWKHLAAPGRHKNFSVDNFFAEVQPDVARLLQIAKEHNTFRVRYEALIETPGEIEKLRDAVKSPVRNENYVGRFHGKIQRGKYEVDLHGGKVTSKSIGAWETAPDNVKAQAEAFYTLMKDYNNFWGY
jgi:hypothetical protein